MPKQLTQGSRRYQPLGLMLIDAATGQDKWKLEQAQRCGQSRITVTPDVDGDGVRDFACASVTGTSPMTLKVGESTKIGLADVYVDWISGATGLPISWASHAVASVPREIGRAEIDAVRCGLHGLDPQIVEVDFVSGSTREIEMDSMTIQFHPTTQEAVAVASGVTLCASEQAAAADTRVFYRRPGPYLDGEERLVFLRDAQPHTIRLGESEILATWSTVGSSEKNTRKLAALKGLTSERLSVIDVDRQETLWSTVPNASDIPAFVPIQRQDGSFDFLVSRPHYNSAPQLLDGATGKKHWTMSAEPGGGIMHAVSVPAPGQPERMLLVGNGQEYSADSERPDSFRMSMVNAANGRVLWSKEFLHGALRINTPDNLDDILFMDVTGDGIPDVIGPEQLENEKDVRIAVWNGTNGDSLWMTEPLKQGSQSRYFPGPFVAIRVDGKPRLIHITAEQGLIVRNATTGRTLLETPMSEAVRRLAAIRRFTPEQYGAIADCSTEDGAKIYLASNDRDTLETTAIAVEDQKTTIISTTKEETKHRTRRVWFKNVLGDNSPELLMLQRDALVCHDVAIDNVIWRVDLSDEYHRNVTYNEQSRTAWVFESRNLSRPKPEDATPAFLVDLTNGKVLARCMASQFTDGQMPHVLAGSATEGKQREMTLLWPQASGTRVQHLSETKPTNAIAKQDKPDPRRVGYFKIAQHRRSIKDIVFRGIRSAIMFFAAVLPFLYVGVMLVRRRWSLSFFLLAPLILSLFLIVVRSSSFGIATFLEGFAWFATPAGIILAFGFQDHRLPQSSQVAVSRCTSGHLIRCTTC